MNNDTGTGWAQRWFAKLFVKGSIPSRVSIYREWNGPSPIFRPYRNRQFKFWLGRMVALWVLHAPDGYRSFRAGLLYDIETTHARSPSMMARLKDANRIAKLESESKRYKAEMIAAKRTISEMKRNTRHKRD